MAFDQDAYRVLHLIAVGGMAEVYLARQRVFPGIERLVVVKRLLPAHRDDEEFVTMFLDEARISAHIQHPHVVQLYDATRLQDDVFLVMEYVDGVSLRKLLDAALEAGRVLSVGEAASIGLTLADTLAFVHEAKDENGSPLHVVHRDLTPGNVLISWAGAIKIIDFGIARGDNRVYETATGMVKGTAGYMAPEQLGEGVPDARTDVFTLGVVLYEMFTGKHPFATRTMFDLYDVIMQGRFEPPEQRRPELGPSASRLVTRCLQADPRMRPQTMREVAAELHRVVADAGYVPTFRGLSDLVQDMVRAPSRRTARETMASELFTDVEHPTQVQRRGRKA